MDIIGAYQYIDWIPCKQEMLKLEGVLDVQILSAGATTEERQQYPGMTFKEGETQFMAM